MHDAVVTRVRTIGNETKPLYHQKLTPRIDIRSLSLCVDELISHVHNDVWLCMFIDDKVLADESRKGMSSKSGRSKEKFWNVKDLKYVKQNKVYGMLFLAIFWEGMSIQYTLVVEKYPKYPCTLVRIWVIDQGFKMVRIKKIYNARCLN